MKNLSLILFFQLSWCYLTFGQDVEFKKRNFTDEAGFNEAMINITKGDEYFSKQIKWLYYKAKECYLKANEFNPHNSLLNFKIGICCLYTTDKAASLEYFIKAQSLNYKVDPKLNYALAQGYHHNLQFDEAIKYYNSFISNYKGEDKNSLKPVIVKKIEECENGKLILNNPLKIEVNNLGPVINTAYSDYVPLVTSDENQLFFTSRREGSTGNEIEPNEQEYFEDVYQSIKVSGQWTEPKKILGSVNTASHDASVGLSTDGKEILIYRGMINGGDLYQSVLENSLWSSPKAISRINTLYHETSACLTPDKKTMYMVSDREDKTLGMRDIFVSRMDEKGDWSEPENLGNIVNTPFDEEGVSLSEDGNTLYFSSTGHNTMGGFDMFKSVFENGKWSVPQNMGYPLNTPGDEMYPQVLGINDDMHGYFSATRKEGLGSIDIYSFQFIKDQIVQKSTSDSTDNPENYSVPVDSGDPANLFVNVGNDTLNKNKTTVNNDPVANNDPQVNNNQLVENNKTDNPVIETPPILSSENVAFKVQVGACHREIPYAELHQRYPGKKAVSMESHDGWYKYLIGNYKKYNEAKQEKIACGTSDAWVVVYRDGKRIHISEVLNLLSYYPYNKLLILMLS